MERRPGKGRLDMHSGWLMISVRGRGSTSRSRAFAGVRSPSRQRQSYPPVGRRPNPHRGLAVLGRSTSEDDLEFRGRNVITYCLPALEQWRETIWAYHSPSLTSSDGARALGETSCNTQLPAVRDAADRRRHRSSLEGVEPWPRGGPPERRVGTERVGVGKYVGLKMVSVASESVRSLERAS